jgi:hypothetical protein
MTYYLKNITDKDLIDPDTGEVLKAGAVKYYDNEFHFLRMTALFNGEVRVLSEKEYYEIINNPPYREKEETPEVVSDSEKPKSKTRRKEETETPEQ